MQVYLRTEGGAAGFDRILCSSVVNICSRAQEVWTRHRR